MGLALLLAILLPLDLGHTLPTEEETPAVVDGYDEDAFDTDAYDPDAHAFG